ncbi:MAG: amidohydrolase [Erysipelotrichaceae bacterium]|nr:amidohydrolase [Erysipelotrichaceae bacterium]
MKNRLNQYIDDHKQEIYQLGDALFNSPELGFKEFHTKQIIISYLEDHGLKVDRTFCQSGLSVRIGSGAPHIGLIAEMDAIPTLGHPCASATDNAAHACGHSTQMTSMLAALDAVNQIISDLPGTVTLYFTPAEEFTDMNYRRQAISEGKIRYASGKQNMLVERIFDEEDLLIHLHACSQTDKYHFSIGSRLAGFIYKRITFHGKTAHAAMGPDKGHNALNMCVLFLDAVNMLRETFREEDSVRLHGMIDKGGDTVNSIPSEVVYECYVRTSNFQFLFELNDQIDNVASHCAQALGGSAEIEDTPGYLPLVQSDELNEVLYPNLLQFYPEDQIRHGESSMAAGDVGDIAAFKPLIQYGYCGIGGNLHGADMYIKDPEEVYITQAKVLADTVYDLLADPQKVRKVTEAFKPSMTYDQYIAYLDGKRKG